MMDRRRRNKREVIRVNWDRTDKGAWHYVPRSNLQVLPGSEFNAGGRVALKYKGETWHGTIAAKEKKKRLRRGR